MRSHRRQTSDWVQKFAVDGQRTISSVVLDDETLGMIREIADEEDGGDRDWKVVFV